MAAVFTHTSIQSNTHSRTARSITELTPLFDQTRLQMVVDPPGAVEASLEHSPYLTVDCIEIRAAININREFRD